MPLLIKMLLLCWSSRFPEMSRCSPPACCVIRCTPNTPGRAHNCCCLLVAKGFAPFSPGHRPCHPRGHVAAPHRSQMALAAPLGGRHSPCAGTGAGGTGPAVLRGCSFGVPAVVPRPGGAAGSLGRGARVPTSICKHSRGALRDGWHRAGARGHWAGPPGKPWRAALAQGFRTPSLFARRGAGASRPGCPQRCSGRGQGGCWGRVKRFLPQARAVEEPPRLAGWCQGWFSSCAPSIPWTEPLSQGAPRADLPRLLSCVPLTFGARSP